MPTPSKDTQIAEGQNRELVRGQQEKSGVPQATADELSAASQVFDDPARGEMPEPITSETQPERTEEPKAPIDLRAAKRAEISARFRDSRNDEPEGDDFSRSGTPEGFDHPVPDLIPQEEVVEETIEQPQTPDPQAEPQGEPQPKMVKVKIRGQEFEVSEDDYHAAAQKTLAGDSYLNDAKARLNQAEELYRDLENRAKRLPQPGEHHAGQETVQPGQQEPQTTADPQHPEDDPIAKAIELIQYGDPAEARQLLDSALETKAVKVATAVVQNTLQGEKFKNEAAQTEKVLKDFEDQHPDLAKDRRSRAAIQATVLQFQRADLEALGVNPDKLPTRSGRVTDDDIATAHRWYRTQGYSVRPPAKLLEDARDDFLAWRGAPKGTEDPQADPNPDLKAPPRIAVQVDRTQRRQAIPQQPSRSAAPQRTMTPQTPQPRDRSAIVADIKGQRAKPRGKVLGV